MATDHTEGEPPSFGSTMRANIGCTANRSKALVNTAAENATSTKRECNRTGLGGRINAGPTWRVLLAMLWASKPACAVKVEHMHARGTTVPPHAGDDTINADL
jgi:hypothetical protein